MRAKKIHEYNVALAWEGNQGTGTTNYAGYGRRFRVTIEGKPDLLGSADPAFRGDADLHNPEDLLVAAVASCHMLSYLALCARQGISVVRYEDDARGTMTLRPDGGGSFEEITLRPRVTVTRASDVATAAALHERAHEICFIAGSCNFPIRHQAEIRTEQGA